MLSQEVFIGMNNQNDFDLTIIGSGSIGSCIALEASKLGLKVALLDAGDISCGTSCRSTKLLHGGVRYLELAFKQFDLSQLNLVREALVERKHWINHAPFLAHQIELTIPSNNCFSKAYYGSGLRIYDYLSGDNSIAKSRFISNTEIQELFPLLKKCPGGVCYSDGQFDDARLNLLMALTAEKAGATIANYCKALDFEYTTDGKLKGVITEDSIGDQLRWNTKVVINATGIHADNIRKKVDSNIERRIFTSRGAHLVLKDNLCPLKKGLLLPSTEDGRVLFILPYHEHTLIGTTDIPCSIQDAQKPSTEEEEYLLSHLKSLFPSLKNPECISKWAGARPLVKPQKTKNSSQIVREHEIETLPCGLISAMGGKWTTCRRIALDALKAVEVVLDRRLSNPTRINLTGSLGDPAETKFLLKQQANELREHLPNNELLEKQINHLQSKYGLNALQIIKESSLNQLEPLSKVIPICNAEILHDISHEHAKTSTDVLARRSRLAMVDFEEAKRLLPIVQKHLSNMSLPTSELNLEH